MAATIPTKEPSVIVAGDTLKFDKTFADYSASDGWVVTYHLVNSTNAISFPASAFGSIHRVNVTAETTGGWVEGNYKFLAKAALAGETVTVFGPVDIEIQLNLAGGGVVDTRNVWQKVVDLMRAAMLSGASRQTSSVQTGDVTVTWNNSTDFLAKLNYAESRASAGNGKSRRILTRFSKTR